MTNTLISGLIITAVGMGLVFAAIVFLWGMMALMVRLGNWKEADQPEENDLEETVGDLSSGPERSVESRKRLAAVAALSVALAERAGRNFPLEPLTDLPGGTWQSVQRAQVLQGKANVFTNRSTRRV
jgi:Na+-transporting methylmalonyl-CoA/oxaloacetate decarboxylase gamma subunit